MLPVPEAALASNPAISLDRMGSLISANVWFPHASADIPLKEMKICSGQYDMVLSLLCLPRSAEVWPPWEVEQ